jgi:anti-sigma factor RsiW
MKCNEFSDRISAYLEDELGGDTRTAMDEHTGECSACAQRLSRTQVLTERLGQLPRAQPSAGFDFALRSRLLMEVSKEGRLADRLGAFFRPAFPRFALAGATAVLVLLGASSVLMEDEQIPKPVPVAKTVRVRDADVRVSTVTERGALKLKALSSESYPVSGRYYRDREDSLRAAAKRLPARSRGTSDVRPVTVRF